MNTKRPLLIIGAGGFGRETASLVADIDTFELVGFLEDDKTTLGTEVSGVPVVGAVDFASSSDFALVVTTGSHRTSTRDAQSSKVSTSISNGTQPWCILLS
jgi:FlaA1/EpsC-like NDP-sugar epimerase